MLPSPPLPLAPLFIHAFAMHWAPCDFAQDTIYDENMTVGRAEQASPVKPDLEDHQAFATLRV